MSLVERSLKIRGAGNNVFPKPFFFGMGRLSGYWTAQPVAVLWRPISVGLSGCRFNVSQIPRTGAHVRRRFSLETYLINFDETFDET